MKYLKHFESVNRNISIDKIKLIPALNKLLEKEIYKIVSKYDIEISSIDSVLNDWNADTYNCFADELSHIDPEAFLDELEEFNETSGEKINVDDLFIIFSMRLSIINNPFEEPGSSIYRIAGNQVQGFYPGTEEKHIRKYEKSINEIIDLFEKNFKILSRPRSKTYDYTGVQLNEDDTTSIIEIGYSLGDYFNKSNNILKNI